MTVFKSSLLGLCLASSGLFALQASAASDEQKFGNPYQTAAEVFNTQAQVVYYRTAQQDQHGAAHVYVDGEFQTSLLAGGYSTFCVAPGSHTLGAYVKDAPLYKGKAQPGYRMDFEGGKTYFVQVDDALNGRPMVQTRSEAERKLSNLRQQQHVLSRASAVEACQYQPMTHKDYTLAGDILFRFGKSGLSDITGAGRSAVGALIKQLHQDDVKLDRIEVIGHTDDIGSRAGNMALGLKRATTIREMLMDGGLPGNALIARSAGSNEPVVNDCSGNRQAQIECKAPNRRVVVRVAVDQ
jgi:OOP family OmpA-OmpF porin